MKAEYGIGGRPNIVMAFHTICGQPNKNGNDGTFGRFGMEGAEQVSAGFRGRGLQRRDGNYQ
jgi:hypothetical protein